MVNGWIVARTQPNREAWAAENVARQGHLHYIPRILETKKSVARARPLFPSYIFVKTEGHWRFLLGTFGIAGVVLFGEYPAMLRDPIVENIRALEVDGLVVLPAAPERKSPFEVGTPLRVRGGIMSGCVGIYEGVDAKFREKVLLDFLGRKMVILFETKELEVA